MCEISSPILLYHANTASIYPTNDDNTQLVAVRFTHPVRISSIRITPEGVSCLSGIGRRNHSTSSVPATDVRCTYPTKFTGRLLLNLSPLPNPTDPVNALASCAIEYDEKNGYGWELDFPVDMPEGVSTRYITLLAPIERLTLSIYGVPTTPDLPRSSDASLPSSSLPASGPHTTEISRLAREDDKTENLSWAYLWAGEQPSSLFKLLSSKSHAVRERTMSCIDLLSEQDSSLIPALVAHPSIINCFFMPNHPLIDKLVELDGVFALPDLHLKVPKGTWLGDMLVGSIEKRRQAAWNFLFSERLNIVEEAEDALKRSRVALAMLRDLGSGDVIVGKQVGDNTQSKLHLLINLCENWTAQASSSTVRCLNLSLAVINRIVADLQLNQSPERRLTIGYLARKVPFLVLIANVRRSPTQAMIHLPFKANRDVSAKIARILLASASGITSGQSHFEIAKVLAEPYLATLDSADPLITAFSLVEDPNTSVTAMSTSTVDERRVHRFATSLSNTNHPNGIQHFLTPSELLSVLGPSLLTSLANAPNPLLGIESSFAGFNKSGASLGSASTFAGKVYTSHEFRTREGASPAPVRGGTPGIIQGNSGVVSGGGLGSIGARAASRHVDDFAGR